MSEPLSGAGMGDFMAGLAAYMEKRDEKRADDANELLARFTPRERSLMRDVAVMAFARGRMFGDGDHPKDSDVFMDVLIALTVEPEDAYPAVLQGATYIEQGG